MMVHSASVSAAASTSVVSSDKKKDPALVESSDETDKDNLRDDDGSAVGEEEDEGEGEGISGYHRNDILLGRGKFCQGHPGNGKLFTLSKRM